jgi:hypothetical protein
MYTSRLIWRYSGCSRAVELLLSKNNVHVINRIYLTLPVYFVSIQEIVYFIHNIMKQKLG